MCWKSTSQLAPHMHICDIKVEGAKTTTYCINASQSSLFYYLELYPMVKECLAPGSDSFRCHVITPSVTPPCRIANEFKVEFKVGCQCMF